MVQWDSGRMQATGLHVYDKAVPVACQGVKSLARISYRSMPKFSDDDHYLLRVFVFNLP